MAALNEIRSAVIDKATIATHEIIPAVTGKKIRVHNYTLISAGVQTAVWKSATTAKSGAIPLAANTGASPTDGDRQSMLFETAAGEALNLTLTAAVQVSGHVAYDLV